MPLHSPSHRHPLGRRARLAAFVPLIAATVALAGCTGGGHTTTGTKPKITEAMAKPTKAVSDLQWALYAEPSSLDPIYSNDFPPLEVLANVCESLLRITPDMKIEPSLAESWTTPDPLTWVYRLRPGVTFQSGAPLTAADVAYSLNRNLDPKLGSFNAAVYANVASITATGTDQVTIKLKRPDQMLNEALATNAGRIVNKAVTQAQGKKFGTPGSTIDCTGPYRLVSWQAGASITLEKYDGYWDTSLPRKVDKIDFSFVRDPAARINALLSGQVQGSWDVPSSGYARLASSGKGTLAFGKTSGSYVAMVSSLTGPLADQRIRRALAMSIDRTGLIRAAVQGAADPLYTPASPGTWGYDRAAFQKAYDAIAAHPGSIADAKKLVAEAGAPTTPIKIAVTNSQPEMPIVGDELQRAAEAIGLKAQIVTLPADGYNALYSDAGARKGIDMIFSLWQTDFPDPTQLYQFLQSDNFYNLAGWKNPTFDALVDKAVGSEDPSVRAQAIIDAQKISVDDPTWLPIYSPYNAVFLGSGLTGAPTASVQLNYPWAAMIGGK